MSELLDMPAFRSKAGLGHLMLACLRGMARSLHDASCVWRIAARLAVGGLLPRRRLAFEIFVVHRINGPNPQLEDIERGKTDGF